MVNIKQKIDFINMLHVPHSLKHVYFEKKGKNENKDKAVGVNLKEMVDFLNPELTSCIWGSLYPNSLTQVLILFFFS